MWIKYISLEEAGLEEKPWEQTNVINYIEGYYDRPILD